MIKLLFLCFMSLMGIGCALHYHAVTGVHADSVKSFQYGNVNGVLFNRTTDFTCSLFENCK